MSSSPHRWLSTTSRAEGQINPSIIVIIIILTIIFFLSGCLHLLIRCIIRNPRRNSNSIVTLTALQGQLQQLFHLHDSGVEQAFIDALPVFFFKAVTGLKAGADCAVCLCEFEAEDRLRLLPNCSHAFHIQCIDTWLLSHSTCPLCRRSLLPEGAAVINQAPVVESSRGNGDGLAEAQIANVHSEAEAVEMHYVVEENHTGEEGDNAYSFRVLSSDDVQIVGNDGRDEADKARGRVMPVVLGRFRITGDLIATPSRRSYSVGSYEYVLDPSNLQVVIAPTPSRRRTSTPRPFIPGHKNTLSDFTPGRTPQFDCFCGKTTDGFSSPLIRDSGPWVSINLDPSSTEGDRKKKKQQEVQEVERKIMRKKALLLLGGRKGANSEEADSSRRAFSFRMPLSDANLDAKLKVSASRRSLSETEVTGWDGEDGSFSVSGLTNRTQVGSNIGSLDLHKGMPSIAKRTINWLVNRPKRIMHASAPHNSIGR